jgi:hypothetical protein
MVIYKCKHNVYYPTPDRGCGLICGSRRIRYYRGCLLVSAKQPSTSRLSLRDSK